MKSVFEWILSTALICLIMVTIFTYPAVKNYLTGTDMIVVYTWVGPNTVQIRANADSAIPQGYSLYVYRVEPTNRLENSFTVPNEGWIFVAFTQGWKGQIEMEVNHTEMIQAVCVRTGTNPDTGFEKDLFPFDTADTRNFAIQIACR